MVTNQRARLLSEARLPYLSDGERQTLARFLDRLETHASDRVQHVIFFGSKARGMEHLLERAKRFVARVDRFLKEQGFEPSQGE